MSEPRPTVVCPNCGATFKKGKLACPECGSDERTGWKSQEEVDYESVDIPDLHAENPVKAGPIPRPVMVVVALLTAAALVSWLVLGAF